MHRRAGELCGMAQDAQKAEMFLVIISFWELFAVSFQKKVGFGLDCMWIWMDQAEVFLY